jgi:hypothetical protein
MKKRQREKQERYREKEKQDTNKKVGRVKQTDRQKRKEQIKYQYN